MTEVVKSHASLGTAAEYRSLIEAIQKAMAEAKAAEPKKGLEGHLPDDWSKWEEVLKKYQVFVSIDGVSCGSRGHDRVGTQYKAVPAEKKPYFTRKTSLHLSYGFQKLKTWYRRYRNSQYSRSFFNGLYQTAEALGHDIVINVQRVHAPDESIGADNFEPVFDVYFFAREDKATENPIVGSDNEVQQKIKGVLPT